MQQMCSITTFENSLKTKWKYTSENKEKLFETPECLYTSNKYILLSVSKFKSKLDLEITQHLVLLDAIKGVKIFDQKLNSTKNKKLYINTFIDENAGEIIVIGEYYNNKDNVNKAKSLGLFLNKYDTTGNLLTTKELAWGKDFKKFAKLNPNGTNEDGAYTYFHKIVKTNDDKYFIIGEQYKKSVSALGIATVVLSKGQSGGVMNFDVMDMIVMELDSGFNIQQLKSYDKKKNSVNLGGSYSYLAPPAISRLMAMNGYFDYLFTSIDQVNNKFYASYLSSEKNKETNKKEGYVGTIGYDNGLIHDKLVVKSDANTIRIMQGKPGYVTFLEYYKKKKIMKARLEKINLE